MKIRVQFSAILLILLTTAACLAQTPFDYVMSNRRKVEANDRLMLDAALLEWLIDHDRVDEARELAKLEATKNPELVLYASVLLDQKGRNEAAGEFVDNLLPTGPFEARMDVKSIYLKGSSTAKEAESRLALLRERGGLDTQDLALTVATFYGPKEALQVFSEALAIEKPVLDTLPLVKVYKKVASQGVPEAEFWAGQVESRIDDLGFDNWRELYFGLPRREATTIELLEKRLFEHIAKERDLPNALSLYFQSEQASLPLEARLSPLLDTLSIDSPLDRLDSFSDLPDLALYLGYRGQTEFAEALIAKIGEMIAQELDAAQERGEDPERLATAREGRTELLTQLRVGVAAGLWCAGEEQTGLAMASEACDGDEKTALKRMAEQTYGNLGGYDDIARLVPDQEFEVWAPAAASQMSDQIDVTYWMNRIRNLPPIPRADAVAAISEYPGLPENVQKELASLSDDPEPPPTGDGEAELQALEALSPGTDGWTLVLLSILSLDALDLSPSQRERLEAYCKKH
ncbi:MAG: hypothetical protein KC800_01185 [Candidatus Eremiobacteraeota bacterium]|nr:hypothetical protein [Candidatus Eremiobacteraeota bacterium]